MSAECVRRQAAGAQSFGPELPCIRRRCHPPSESRRHPGAPRNRGIVAHAAWLLLAEPGWRKPGKVGPPDVVLDRLGSVPAEVKLVPAGAGSGWVPQPAPAPLSYPEGYDHAFVSTVAWRARRHRSHGLERPRRIGSVGRTAAVGFGNDPAPEPETGGSEEGRC